MMALLLSSLVALLEYEPDPPLLLARIPDAAQPDDATELVKYLSNIEKDHVFICKVPTFGMSEMQMVTGGAAAENSQYRVFPTDALNLTGLDLHVEEMDLYSAIECLTNTTGAEDLCVVYAEYEHISVDHAKFYTMGPLDTILGIIVLLVLAIWGMYHFVTIDVQIIIPNKKKD